MLPLAGAVVGITALLLLALVELGVRTIERAEAQSAADMAAIAGVHEGRSGAEDLAARNRADLTVFEEVDGAVRVRVQLGEMQAEAWAELDWSFAPIPGAAP